jgi:predicted LPLAT superfamily acyltransferase
VNEQPATHWVAVTESGFAWGMRFMYGLNRFFGRWPFRIVLVPVVVFYVLTHGLARRASLDYLRRLEAFSGAVGHRPGWRDVFRHLNSFAEMLLDKALAVGGRYPWDKVRFEGRELMLESLGQRRGGLLLTTHMGCLEACRLVAERRQGLTLNVLVHTGHAAKYNTVLKELDPNTQIKLLQVAEFDPSVAAMLSEKLGRGEFVVVAADRVPVAPGAKTITVPFLGAPARFPMGPWALAASLKCQVIFFSVVREAEGYRAHFERVADIVELPRGQREASVRPFVERYAQYLEGLCSRSPWDWYNFFPFWSDSGA